MRIEYTVGFVILKFPKESNSILLFLFFFFAQEKFSLHCRIQYLNFQWQINNAKNQYAQGYKYTMDIVWIELGRISILHKVFFSFFFFPFRINKWKYNDFSYASVCARLLQFFVFAFLHFLIKHGDNSVIEAQHYKCSLEQTAGNNAITSKLHFFFWMIKVILYLF